MMTSYQARKLIAFQMVNLGVTILIRLGIPFDIRGGGFISILFALKMIALLYWNDYPAQRDRYALLFFVIAVTEVILVFVFGSFSIYSFAYVSLFG
ncbi:hypothetical protein [Loktanella sp. M215]|uniref:hypothetical protein n=1 Tax=Loktanella sp. M215 TaxID=2675431 RepID=UPI001F233666|nr:hypothetical protein [Loktanella sp. M215]MCF7702146.1 hypothetical protein [Loktanella sp. M215]